MSELGTALGQMLMDINIAGFGSDPIAIAFSVMIAIAVTQGDMFIKGKYTNTVIVFLASYVGFFTAGLATSLPLIVIFTVIGVVGIILHESTQVYQ